MIPIVCLLAAAAATLPPPAPPPMTATRIARIQQELAGSIAVEDPLTGKLKALAEIPAALKTGDGQRALAKLSVCRFDNDRLKPYLLDLRSQTLLLLGREREAREAIREALALEPPAALSLRLFSRLLPLAAADGTGRQAAKDALAFTTDAEDLPGLPALILDAAATLQDERSSDAFNAYRDLAVRYPTTIEADEAEAILRKRRKEPFTLAERLTRCHKFHESRHYRSLRHEIEALRRLPSKPPKEDRRFLVRAWALALLKTGDTTDAIGALGSYEAKVDAFPEEASILAAAYGKVGKEDRRDRILNAILDAASPDDTQEMTKAREDVGRQMAFRLETSGAFLKAAALDERLAQLFRQSSRHDLYLFRAAVLYRLSGKPEDAARLLRREIEDHPESRVTAAALYHRALIKKNAAGETAARRDVERLLSEFPTSFYAFAARKDFQSLAAEAPPAKEIAEDRRKVDWRQAALDQGEGGEAALLLLLAGLGEEAATEASSLGDPAAAFIRASAYRELGRPHEARRALLSAYPDLEWQPPTQLPAEALDILYPIGFLDNLKQAAARERLPLSLLLGVIFQESNFDSQATSPSGAMGLMQLMPATFEELSRKQKRHGSPYDAELNILLGAGYLKSLSRRFGGSIEKALVAYNGGPGRLSRLLSRLPKVDRITLIDSIPITETRLYVKKVVRASHLYAQIYGPF